MYSREKQKWSPADLPLPTTLSTSAPVPAPPVVVLCSVVADCKPTGCSPLGSFVHGIFQASILKWVAVSSSRRSSQPLVQTLSPCISWFGTGSLSLCHPGSSLLTSGTPKGDSCMCLFVCFVLKGDTAGELLWALDLSCSGCRLQDSGPSAADDGAGPDQDACRVCPADAVCGQRRRRKPEGTTQDARDSLRALRSHQKFLLYHVPPGKASPCFGWWHFFLINHFVIVILLLFLDDVGSSCCTWAFSTFGERGSTLCCWAWTFHFGGLLLQSTD